MSSKANVGYGKLRFKWKEQVFASSTLGRGAKLLAVCLCDTYVNRDTGQCFPSNRALAHRMNTCTRTVQRHLKELLEGGWLRPVQKRSVRRAFQLAFPNEKVAAPENDRTVAPKVTKTSPEHDKSDAPYKNQRNNQGTERFVSQPLKFHLYSHDAVSPEWKNWIRINTDQDPDQVLGWLRNGTNVCLPSKYPPTGYDPTYSAFFEAVISTKGACLRI